MRIGTLCYVRSGGRTLMMHRVKKPGDVHWGRWNGLGGKLMPGETPEECVCREVLEESGLRILEPRLCGVLTFPAFEHDEDWYVFVFEAGRFSGTLTGCSEGELAWIADCDLRGLELWEGDRIFMDWIDAGVFFSGRFTYDDQHLVSHEVCFYPTEVSGR
jgi:8-oxo-dGTP diphosphatase